LESISGAAGLLCDTACAGLIGFGYAFARLSQTRFRLILGPSIRRLPGSAATLAKQT